MSDLVELLLEGAIEDRMPMTVEVDPDGGGAVEILPSLRIHKIGAFAPFDNERFLLFPFLHLGKRMPQVPSIPIFQLLSGHIVGHSGRAGLDRPAPRQEQALDASCRRCDDDANPGAARIIRGGDFFDNLRGSYY